MDEGLLRYFSIHEAAKILVFFAHCGRGSDELIEQLEKMFIKHRKAFTPTSIDLCKKGFGQLNKGSEILKRVLEDPQVELPKLE